MFPVFSRAVRLLVAALVLGAGAVMPAGATSAGGLTFNRDIRPILSDHCFACHGPDEKTRKAGLRLDVEADARRVLKSGHSAVVPGKPDDSALMDRVTTDDAEERMPPADTKKPLTPEKIERLKRWIAEGARYEGHWAYLPPRRPEPPEVRGTNWVRNELDRFVLAKLEQEGLSPTGEAPRERLLRRVSLDLTGLPPTVEELDAYLADPDPKAYEKAVDRLLASPHYGERMAQQWLDLARYGETQGYHHDAHRDMWHWRDWVIRAFNENRPYDQFTVEQLAGDLLPDPTREQLVATGFHRNEMTTSEGGALPEEYIVKYAVGRVDTTARVWLGTSMACAECHDHKYDPISTRDFYRFFAFFFDTPENGLDAEPLNPTPRVTLETPEQRARAEQYNREVAALEAAEKVMLEAPRPEWDAAQEIWERRHVDDSLGGWAPLAMSAGRVTRGGALEQGKDGVIDFRAGGASGGTTFELVLHTEAREIGGLRLTRLAGGTDEPAVVLSRVDAEIRSRQPDREVFPEDPVAWGDWQVAGPFPAGSVKEAQDKEFGPERDVDGSAGQEWRPIPEPADGAVIRFGERQGATYFSRVLEVRQPRILEGRVDAEAGVRVWLNGNLVLSRAAVEPGKRGESSPVRLWLRPGRNRLLVKAAHRADDRAGFRFEVGEQPVTVATLEFVQAVDDRHTGSLVAAGMLDDNPETGWSTAGASNAVARAWLVAREAFGFRGGTEIVLRLRFQSGPTDAVPRRFEVAAAAAPTLREFASYPPEVREALAAGEGGVRGEAQRGVLRRFFRERGVAEVGDAQRLLASRRKERDDFRNGWPTAMVMRAAQPPRETHVRIRGQYFNKGEKVDPGVPEQLLAWDPGLPRNRLGLARWLMDPRHPLTARVAVNQHWQRYFGVGLVKTAEEFGSQGEWPSHPDLLDWLASEFVRTGWNVKALQRLIVTSATYRQDSVVSRELLERDPENRLLARGARFRLDAENLRDVSLAASGLLNRGIGGPSVFPFQPPGLWGQVAFEGTRDYVQSSGADNYRRGLYTYWRRSIPYASFTVLDAPSREVCVVRRPRTNTPLQALALLNDPVYVEAARVLAQRILAEGGPSTNERLDFAFRVTLGRRPAEAERARLAAACEREFRNYAENRKAASELVHVGASRPPSAVDVAELAAWTVVANTLLNLDETLTKG